MNGKIENPIQKGLYNNKEKKFHVSKVKELVYTVTLISSISNPSLLVSKIYLDFLFTPDLISYIRTIAFPGSTYSNHYS